MSPKPFDTELYSRLGRIEGKLDAIVEAQERDVAAMTQLESRVDRLEGFKSRSLGMLVGMAIAAGASGGGAGAIIAALTQSGT